MSGAENVIEVTEDTFEFDVIQQSHEKPVVVDFWAPWCAPCRMLGPILERLVTDPSFDFVLAKINVDDNPNISMRYSVQGIPAVKAFVEGQVADEFVGALPEPQVRQFIQKLVPNDADIAFRAANSYLATRHWPEAEDAFRDLLMEYPNYPGATLNLAKSILAQARGCEAKSLLESCLKSKDMLQVEKLLPLAHYLCWVESNGDAYDIEPIEAQYRRSAELIRKGNLEAAMDGILDVLRQDKRYRNGEPKDVMLAIFSLLGDGDPMTQNYRNEMAMILF